MNGSDIVSLSFEGERFTAIDRRALDDDTEVFEFLFDGFGDEGGDGDTARLRMGTECVFDGAIDVGSDELFGMILPRETPTRPRVEPFDHLSRAHGADSRLFSYCTERLSFATKLQHLFG